MNIMHRFSLVVPILAVAASAAGSSAQLDDATLAHILAVHSAYRNQIGSIETRFRAENTLAGDSLSRFTRRLSPSQATALARSGGTERWTTIYAAKGERYL